jgi:hypothetical protein
MLTVKKNLRLFGREEERGPCLGLGWQEHESLSACSVAVPLTVAVLAGARLFWLQAGMETANAMPSAAPR